MSTRPSSFNRELLQIGRHQPARALRVYGSTTGFNARQQMLFTAANVIFHYHPNDTLQTEFIGARLFHLLCGWRPTDCR
jgi:hypothetical protein